jgi:predicted CXXCH cytochrome family protein
MRPARLVVLSVLALGAFAVVVTLAPMGQAASPMASPSTGRTRFESSGCLVCHGRPEIRSVKPGDEGKQLFVPVETIGRSVHISLACTDCHPRPSALLHGDPAAEIRQAQASCVRCHTAEGDAYSGSVHAKAKVPVAATEGPPDGSTVVMPVSKDGTSPASRPTCITCHGAHGVTPASGRAFVVASAALCSGCHVENGKSFFDRNYHGKEASLGRTDVALCSDCHNAHDVRAASDSKSPVAPANRVGTCGSCHPGGGKSFSEIQIHVAGQVLPADAKLRAVTLYMMALLALTFTFFGVHTALGFLHNIRQLRRVEAEGGEERVELDR